jgi:hypothetical protein
MWWRLELLLKGMAKRLVRGGGYGIAATEIALLHQALLRLERRIEILEANNGNVVSTESKEKSDVML